jgi:hypothetical protein
MTLDYLERPDRVASQLSAYNLLGFSSLLGTSSSLLVGGPDIQR